MRTAVVFIMAEGVAPDSDEVARILGAPQEVGVDHVMVEQRPYWEPEELFSYFDACKARKEVDA